MISLLNLGLTVSIPGLERALQQYTLEPSEKPFDLKSVPLATTPMAEQRAGKALFVPHSLCVSLGCRMDRVRRVLKRGSSSPCHLLLHAVGTVFPCMLLSGGLAFITPKH